MHVRQRAHWIHVRDAQALSHHAHVAVGETTTADVVTDDDRLVGILTESDFIRVALWYMGNT